MPNTHTKSQRLPISTNTPIKPSVLITGASSGIGYATAVLLHKKGYKVYAASRSLDRMKDLAEQGIDIVEMDVTNDSSIKSALQKIGPITVLVNNAGYGSYGAVEDVGIDEARAQFEVNLFGLARLTQLVLPAMRKAGKGTIINISSVAGLFGEPLGAWYHASKYALEGFSDSLRQEVEPFGVTVTLVEPGAILTKWGDHAIQGLEKVSGSSDYAKQIPHRTAFLQRTTNPASASPPAVVANKIAAILQTASPRFRYPVGRGARWLVLSRRLTTDRIFYWLLQKF